jgi:UDP-glucose 4-epimerase
MSGQMTKILITGGAGFIGGHLTRYLLSRGIDVVILDDLSSSKRENIPDDVPFFHGSVLDQQMVAEALDGAEACVHLAAIASVVKCNEQLVSSHTVNATGIVQIID